MSITVADLRAWLDLQSPSDVLAMGRRSMLYVVGESNPPSIEIGLEHEDDCDHSDFYRVDNEPDADNVMECRDCGIRWEAGCLDEDDGEAEVDE